jgi:hypothetical protein
MDVVKVDDAIGWQAVLRCGQSQLRDEFAPRPRQGGYHYRLNTPCHGIPGEDQDRAVAARS